MNEQPPHSEYLVLSRGQWDQGASKENIESAIKRFYEWYAQNLDAGRMKAGSRLGIEGAVVSKKGIIMDGRLARRRKSSGATGSSWLAASVKPRNSRRKTRALSSDSLSRFAPSNRREPPLTK
jgi:hypothetical protein